MRLHAPVNVALPYSRSAPEPLKDGEPQIVKPNYHCSAWDGTPLRFMMRPTGQIATVVGAAFAADHGLAQHDGFVGFLDRDMLMMSTGAARRWLSIQNGDAEIMASDNTFRTPFTAWPFTSKIEASPDLRTLI